MRTGKEYLASLNDGRQVWVGNEKIDNVATHPLTRDYAQRHADFYDMHLRPELQDELTFVDTDGVRRARQWQDQHDKAGLVSKRKYHDAILRETAGGSFGRMPDCNNYVLTTYADDPTPWEAQSIGTEGRNLAQNIRDFVKLARENDLNVGLNFIDPQVDRSDPDSHNRSPNLRVIESNEDGIIVNGVKAVGTGIVFADYIHIGCFYRPGIPSDQIIFAAIPVNTPGVTILSRESTVKSDAVEHPLASMGDELDSTTVFENVFIPWKQVFHLGNSEHVKLYPQRVFDWLHYHVLIRQVMRAELMAGLAILITENIGTNKNPAVQLRVAKLVGFHQTLLAHMVASEELGFMTVGGRYKPNPLLFNLGRAHFLQHFMAMMYELLDLSGRSPLMIASEDQWKDLRFGPWFEKMNTGAKGEPRERIQIGRVIRDLFLTDWGGRVFMFENFNGTPLYGIQQLTMARAEMSGSGEYGKFASKVCGIELATEDQTAYTKTAAYAKAMDMARGKDAAKPAATAA